jgi:uncharacterized protein with beta-barrel porin domain
MSAVLVGLSAAPANAACAPDPASSGQTVTCSGNTPGGFQAGFGISNLTVNVLPGATVSDGGGGAAISVMDSNTVNNAGTVTAGAFSNGILAFTDDNTVNNLASGTITVGHDSAGISVQGERAMVNNAGAINAGDSGAGIDVFGNDARIASSGTISVQDNAAGISAQGDRSVVSHSGTINGGVGSAGIAFLGSSGTITNSGHIIGGDDAIGIVVNGNSNTITNSGTITVGNGFAVGIDATSFPGSNSIINTGTINVGAGATGILVSGTGTVFNSGTINAATGFAAIELCGCGNSVLTLGPGSVINGLVIGNGTDTLQLGGTGKDTFNLALVGPPNASPFQGFSTFNKVGSSNWTLTGLGFMDWNVLGGTLTVNGAIAGAVNVNAGGTLAGAGVVTDAWISSGGVLQPGNGAAGSFLTVINNLAFQSGALYLVQLNSTTSTFTRVPGNADLNGVVGVSLASGSNVIKQYTIMTTGSHTGTFSAVDAPGGLIGTISSDPTHVYLNFALDFGARFGLSVNQQNVANTLTNFFNANGSIPGVFALLTPAGLSQVSGETATGSQQATFDAMSQFLSLLTDPFIDGRGGGSGGSAGAVPFAEESALGYAAKKSAARDAFAKFPTKADIARSDQFDRRWSVWGSAYGGGSNTSGNAALGSNDATARAFGFAAGADYRLSSDTLAGFALAGGGTNFSVSGFGSGRSDLFQAGAFLRHNMGAAYITAAAAYGWQDVTTERTVTVAGFERLRAQFNANAYSGRIEGGYRYVTPWMGITPYTAGQFTTYSLPAYAEQVLAGAGTFALNYAAKDVTASRTELGVRTDKSFAMSNGILTLRGRAAWAHDFNTDRNVTALFQTLPGAAFVVNGAAQAHDSALVTAAAEMKWLSGWSAAAIFEGQFSNVTNSYAGKGVVRYAW